MITIYPQGTTDFSTNGAGILLPVECKIEERANGMYELRLVHPISDDLRWSQIRTGCIVKASAPVRESPLYELEAIGNETEATTVVRKIYKVDTTTGQRLHLRQKPSTDAKVLGRYPEGTEVVYLGTSGSWYKVSIRKGGAVGYMYAQYLKFHKDVYETVTATKPITRNAVTVSPAREQLFRIHNVEVDTESGMVTAQAMHVFYDLRGNVVNAAYAPEGVDANTAARNVFDAALFPHDFTLYTHMDGKVTGDYGYKSIPECILEPDTGILSQAGGYLVRDNFDVFLLPPLVRDTGVTIRRGKNLLGVVVSTDAADTVTRIIPVGKDKNGNDLFLSGINYVDVTDVFPDVQPAVVLAKRIDYDVRVGTDEGEFSTDAKARAELQRLAQEEFRNGIHQPEYGMRVDFAGVDGPMVTKEYAALQSVHLFDTVSVFDEVVGVSSKILVTGYVWDVLAESYESVTLGVLMEDTATTYGYTLAEGSISGGKIANGAVTAGKIAAGSVTARAITAGAVTARAIAAGAVTAEKIAAGSVNAEKIAAGSVDAQKLAAGSVTAEKIAAGAVKAEKIAAGAVDADKIAADSVTADKIAAGAVKAVHLDAGSVTADKIVAGSIGADRLQAYLITADCGLIASGAIGTAQIADGSITTAKVAELSADVIKAGTLSAERLLLVGDDGLIYRINATSAGLTAAQLTEEKYRNYIDGTVIVAKSLTAAQIAAQTITGNEIAANAVKAANIDVAELFASEATIAQLNAADISGNKYIKLAVEGVEQLGNRLTTAESQINQKADSIALSVLRTEVEGIEVGGRNLWMRTKEYDASAYSGWVNNANTSGAAVTAAPYEIRDGFGVQRIAKAWADVSQRVPIEAGETYTLSAWIRWESAAGVMRLFASGITAVDVSAQVGVDGFRRVSATYTATDSVSSCRFECATDTPYLIYGLKLEKGNKATDWSPAPEDPAKALSTGTTVLIDDEQFNVRTKIASFDIIDDASGEDEELVRIDSDGLTAKDGTFETVHSDSVVGTQAGTTFGPANAGELQAFLDDLSNRFLLGDVNIDVRNITGGNFSVKGLTGGGQLVLHGHDTGVLNALAVRNCQTRVRLYSLTMSTDGVALDLYCSTVYIASATLNANIGAVLDRAQLVMNSCTGTCTTLADSGWGSEFRIMGGRLPYGKPVSNGGEIYSPFEFVDPPSVVETPTVQTATLGATATRTWNGGWLSGDALYQGKVGSDGSLRRGCMWFDLPAISGKTIIGATLTLKRYDGIGGGGSVSVGIYGTTAASASGTPAVGTKYASVSLANGATKSVDVTAAVQALADGSIRGLMVYDTQTGTYNSKNYTYGYCKLYGSSDGAKPVLNVTYK